MKGQIVFNFLFKRKMMELGSDIPVYKELVDLNNRVVPEDSIEEFKNIVLLEQE